jgi:hypothetical protein
VRRLPRGRCGTTGWRPPRQPQRSRGPAFAARGHRQDAANPTGPRVTT